MSLMIRQTIRSKRPGESSSPHLLWAPPGPEQASLKDLLCRKPHPVGARSQHPPPTPAPGGPEALSPGGPGRSRAQKSGAGAALGAATSSPDLTLHPATTVGRLLLGAGALSPGPARPSPGRAAGTDPCAALRL